MRIFGLAGLLWLAAMVATAQQTGAVPNSGVVIRTETKQVLVDAVVTDKKGDYVPDLPQKDFKVLEDGKEQSIRSFSYEAEGASPNSTQGHYLVLFFDNSTMDLSDQAVARRAAGKFVEANAGPNRYMAVVDFSGGVRIAQNFTADAERLRQVVSGATLANVNPNAGTLAIGGDASTGSGPAPGGGSRSLSTGMEAEFGQRDVLLGLRSLAKGLESVPGRKILVLFTEGFPLSVEIRSEITAVTDTCNKANVAIYPIDVRGLVGAAPPALPGPPAGLPGGRGIPPGALLPAAPRGGIFTALGLGGGFGLVQPVAYFQRGPSGSSGPTGGTGSSPGGSKPGGGTPSPSPSPSPSRAPAGSSPSRGPANTGTGTGTRGGTVNNNVYTTPPRIIVPQPPPTASTNQEFMYMLADGTGGFVIANTNDLLGGLDRIGKEQNQYYLIGYTPPDTPEGSCHLLKVRVERGYTVRARSGYCNVRQVDLLAGKPAERDLETRAAAGVPGTVQSAAMQAPFFYQSPNVARLDLALEIPSSSIRFTKVKGHQHADINILGIAYSANGAVGARFSDTVKLDFADKKELDAFLEKPFLHYDTQFDVATGSYDLKVLFSSGGEEFGKLEKNPLTIQPYDGKALFLSGVAFSTDFRKVSESEPDLDAELLDGRAPLVAQGMQITPGGSNHFKKSDTAVCYLEVYEPLLRSTEAPEQAASGSGAAKPAAATTAVTVRVRLLDAKTSDPKVDSGVMDVTRYAKHGDSVIPVAFRLKVEALAAGSYIAEIRAADTRRIVTRSVPFEVVE
ncbi:MAG: VWA domain-containing protein [Bryobacteraceae bacterium]|jgi:VWFA-related protein